MTDGQQFPPAARGPSPSSNNRPLDPSSGLPFAAHTLAMISGGTEAWEVHYQALTRRERGEDVIVLSVGDPDFDTPSPIVDTAIASLRAGETHYTVSGGVGVLAETIAQVESARLGLPICAAQVVTTAGAQNALYSVFRCLLEPGDEALLLAPAYTMFAGLATASGAAVREVALDVEHGFALDVDAIARAITPATRVLLANFPHNPSGAVADPDALAELVNLCRQRGVWLVSDEAYCDLVFNGEFVSPASLTKDTRHVVVVRSLSKSHAMTGWRVGWTLTTPTLSAHLRNLVAHVSYGSSEFVQAGAIAALTMPLPEIAAMQAAYRRRRDVLVEALAKIPGVVPMSPDAGIFCLADVSATGLDGTHFAERLLEQTGVSVLTGAAFSPLLKDHIRISLCEPEDRLIEAVLRIHAMVRQLNV